MQTKLCPQCGAEYYDHVNECIDCHVELKSSEEIEKEKREAQQFLDDSEGAAFVIREGETCMLKEMRTLLLKNGIPNILSLSPGCKPGGCSTTSLLFVSERDGEKAEKILHEHYLRTHPEAAAELLGPEDACPACGFQAGAAAEECPDCGLVLAGD